MNTQTPNEVLSELCVDRGDLLTLGRKFNKEVQKRGVVTDDGLSELNETAEAIFHLEGISLNPSDKELIRKLDHLRWGDEQVIEFLGVMGKTK